MKFPHSQVYSFAFDSICFDVDLCPRKQTQGGHESICMNQRTSWCLHIRIDSSPQFSRDYLVSEVDHVDLSKVFSAQWHSTFRDIVISTRLMPIQVLGRRATNTAFKYRALLRMLHLETGDIDLAKSRTRSFLNDMGVESKLSLVTEQDCVNPVNGFGQKGL